MLPSEIESNSENWQKIFEYELKIWEISLKSPRPIAPETFLGKRLKVEIYTGACDKSPYESGSVDWDSGIGIGRIHVINGNVVVFRSLEVGKEYPLVKRAPISTKTHKLL